MARVLADHQDRTISADYLALLAHRLDGSSNLHRSGSRIDNRIPTRPMNRTAGRTNRPTRPTGKDSRGGASATCRAEALSGRLDESEEEAIVALDADGLDRGGVDPGLVAEHLVQAALGLGRLVRVVAVGEGAVA